MPKFQLILSDRTAKTSKSTILEGPRAQALVGKSLGQEVDGKLLGIGNIRIRITGGTDKDGIPMRFDIQGGAKKRAILSSGVGYRANSDGERVRKLVRGRTITEDTFQVNTVILGESSEPSDRGPSTEKAKR